MGSTSDPSHQTVRLARGSHGSPREGVCVMELASMLAGERFSDHPRSVCPLIGGFLRTYNDAVDDDRRQGLYHYAAEVVGTNDRNARAVRMELCRKLLGMRAPRLPLFGGSHAQELGCQAAHAMLAPDRGGDRAALAFLDTLIECGRPLVAQAAEGFAAEPASTSPAH